MTSTSNRKSPFSQLKEQFFGNPEQSLKEAYEAASRIKSIENRYFSGYRVPVESLTSDRLQAEVLENLEILQGRLEEFNNNSSASGKLGSNHLEKLIFAEGILTNYKMAPGSPGAIVPVGNPPVQSSAASIVDVPSTNASNQAIPRQQPRGRDNSPLNNFFSGGNPLPGQSVTKAFGKIRQDLNPKSEQEVVDEFRRSRAVTVTGIRLLALMIIVPILTQQVSKLLVISPIVDQYRDVGETAIVIDNLNSEWKEEALGELTVYEEQLKMDRMIKGAPPISDERLEEKVQEKATEIAEEFHEKTNNSISNVFADLVGIVAFAFVLLLRRKDISVLKSLIDNIVYGLSDSAKAFGIILFTDIFVGFHSTHGWEVLLESMANHLGVAPNHSAISVFIATVPVMMDTVMKYWIFKYLSQMSASTVATLKEMNE